MDFISLLRDDFKERFGTLETLEGSTYLAGGATLLFAQMLGLLALFAQVVPILGGLLLLTGGYKTFRKQPKKKTNAGRPKATRAKKAKA